MKIEKAIEILDDYHRHPLKSPTLDQIDASKLGIEALKLVSWLRDGHIPPPDFKLPGETED